MDLHIFEKKKHGAVFALVVATASLIASAAFAEGIVARCHFDIECFEAEPCQDADFNLELVETTPAGLATPFGTLDLVARTEAVWVGEGSGMTVVVSPRPPASARASVHITGGEVISYLGRCEVQE